MSSEFSIALILIISITSVNLSQLFNLIMRNKDDNCRYELEIQSPDTERIFFS